MINAVEYRLPLGNISPENLDALSELIVKHSDKFNNYVLSSISDDDIRNEVANEERRYGISEEDKLHHVAHTMNEYNYEHPVGFRYDLSLTEVIIPEGVEFIRRSMFFGCKNLVKVVIPKSVRVIEDYAFSVVKV